ncbi:MAG: GGDEF domain-containing protein [Telluria sp.]
MRALPVRPAGPRAHLKRSGGAVSRRLASWRRRFSSVAPVPPKLDEEDERAFGASVDQALEQLLPVLGPVFGLLVVLFGAWDYWIDPAAAGTTVRIRVALVLIGSLGYVRGRLGWTATGRCVHIYATHVGAMLLAAALLEDGFALTLALPGVVAALFPLALVEPRLGHCAAVLLAPSLLLAGLSAWTLPPRLFLSSMLVYVLALCLAASVAIASGQLRRAAFLARKALLDACHHDSLSGALSRDYLTELAEHDLTLARRHGRPLAVALLDIDWFKRINDRHGHASGDAALRALVQACRKAMRSSDYIGRVGGEEFVCVMPETGVAEALACAERIRERVAALHLPVPGGDMHFTVSLGVCVLDTYHPDWTALLRDADAAMYQAKSEGRNRVVLTRPAAGAA